MSKKRMRRKCAEIVIIACILLWGAAMILWITVDPGIQRNVREGQGTHSIRAIMADLRYERRIKLIREELDTLEDGGFTALFLSMYPIASYNV